MSRIRHPMIFQPVPVNSWDCPRGKDMLRFQPTITMNQKLSARHRLDLLMLMFILLVASGGRVSAEIGLSKAAILERHGVPQRVSDAENIFYQWDVWTLKITFSNGIASKLEYTKNGQISEKDALGILMANGGQDAWRRTGSDFWLGPDGLSARWDATNRNLVIQTGKGDAASQSTPAGSMGTPGSRSLLSTTPSVIKPYHTATPALIQNAPSFHLPIPVSSATPARRSPGAPKPTVDLSPLYGVLGIFTILAIWMQYFARSLETRPKKSMNRQRGQTWSVNRVRTPPPLPSVTPTIDTVRWDQFELVIAEAFRRKGYTVEICAALGADGGVDVKLTRDGALTLVQCKQWKAWKVKVPAIREFYGVLTSEGAQRGIFITSGNFTKDAFDFAQGKPIDLLSRPAVEQLVRDAEQPGENLWDVASWIDGFIAGAWIAKPLCPFCQQQMVLRSTKAGHRLWGCLRFPRCKGKRDVRPDLLKCEVGCADSIGT